MNLNSQFIIITLSLLHTLLSEQDIFRILIRYFNNLMGSYKIVIGCSEINWEVAEFIGEMKLRI